MAPRCSTILVALTCLANVLTGASGIANGMVLCLDRHGHAAIEGPHRTGGCAIPCHAEDGHGGEAAEPTAFPTEGCRDLVLGEQTVEGTGTGKQIGCPFAGAPALTSPPLRGSTYELLRSTRPGPAPFGRPPDEGACLSGVVLLN
jgi:hypothetical protein